MQKNPSLLTLRDALRAFADERDWNQFHSPKNLAMALIAEAGELVEHFQWMTEAQSAQLSPQQRTLRFGHPLKVLNQLAGLGNQGHRQILG